MDQPWWCEEGFKKDVDSEKIEILFHSLLLFFFLQRFVLFSLSLVIAGAFDPEVFPHNVSNILVQWHSVNCSRREGQRHFFHMPPRSPNLLFLEAATSKGVSLLSSIARNRCSGLSCHTVLISSFLKNKRSFSRRKLNMW